MNYFHTISKLELESIILENSRFVKGFSYDRIEGTPTPIKTFGFDKDLNVIKLDDEKCSKTTKFLGVNYKLSTLENQKLDDKFVPFHNCIFGEFEGTFVDKEGKKYNTLFAPIIYCDDTDEIIYIKKVFDIYIGNKTSDIVFYLPGITKELEKHDIHIIKINEQNASKILVKTFTIIKEFERFNLTYFNESVATNILNSLKTANTFEFKPVKFILQESEEGIDIFKILNIMNDLNISMDDIKVNHSGLNALVHSGLFESSSIQILKELKIIN